MLEDENDTLKHDALAEVFSCFDTIHERDRHQQARPCRTARAALS